MVPWRVTRAGVSLEEAERQQKPCRKSPSYLVVSYTSTYKHSIYRNHHGFGSMNMALQLGTILVSIIGMIWSTKPSQISMSITFSLGQREVIRVGSLGRYVINEPNEPLMNQSGFPSEWVHWRNGWFPLGFPRLHWGNGGFPLGFPITKPGNHELPGSMADLRACR